MAKLTDEMRINTMLFKRCVSYEDILTDADCPEVYEICLGEKRMARVSEIPFPEGTDPRVVRGTATFLVMFRDVVEKQFKPQLFRTTFHTLGLLIGDCPKDTLADYQKFKLWLKDLGYVGDNLNLVKPVNARRLLQFFDEQDVDSFEELDIWPVSHFNLAPQRQSPSMTYRSINFTRIKNETNKRLIKKFIMSLLTETDVSMSTIMGRLSVCSHMLNVSDKPYPEWTPEDCDKMLEHLNDGNHNRVTRTADINHMRVFTNFLLMEGLIEDSPIKQLYELTPLGQYQFKTTAPDRYIVNQIFNVLPEVCDIMLVLTYLAIYCTGMRVSEACELKRNCLEERNGVFFIRFYSTKFRKEVSNQIPKALYEMIWEYRHNLQSESEWLFPGGRRNKPINRNTYRDKLREELIRLGVKNPDGSPYRYMPHDFRHLIVYSGTTASFISRDDSCIYRVPKPGKGGQDDRVHQQQRRHHAASARHQDH